jgi:YD repeat-containing protein
VQGVAFGGKVTYSYNKQGKIEQRISYSNKNEQQATLVYRYDSLGNLTAELTYNTVYMVIKELQYKYDERGNRIEKRGVKSPYFGGINFVESYSYDDFNRLIGKEYYSENDSLNWRYSAKYDAQSRLVEEETKDGTGKPISYATYTYDKDGKLLSSYNYDIVQKTPPMRIEHEYNKKGQNTVRYIYVQGAKTPTITKRYYYDEKGNWIMWYEHNHVENEHVIVNRKITYF